MYDETRLTKYNALVENGADPFLETAYTKPQAIFYAMQYGIDGDYRSTAGRVSAKRTMGKISFADLSDESGRIQVYLDRNTLGEDDYKLFTKNIDIGDFVGVEGVLFRTQAGELTIRVSSFKLLAKALANVPLGKKFEDETGAMAVAHTVNDPEKRYRQRTLDLLTNEGGRNAVRTRSHVLSAIRNFLYRLEYDEVETPVLQHMAGGAAARPFTTHHNVLDQDLHLRISLELYLKRLIISGFDRVYEIGRVFRNEGVSTRHNPEFTLLEMYQAYMNLDEMKLMVQAMFQEIASITNHNSLAVSYQGNDIDFTKFQTLPLLLGIEQYANIPSSAFQCLDTAREALESVGLNSAKENTIGGIIEKLHEKFVQPNLIQPTFVVDFPLDTSPLAKRLLLNSDMAERFELYIGGQEIGNAFAEINNPIDQRARFEAQLELRACGDDEAHPMDEEFLEAMALGMPPTTGFGMGIDRVVALFSDSDSVRDAIAFPTVRIKSE